MSLRRQRRRIIQCAGALLLVLAARGAQAQDPLDLLDPTPREVFVRVEASPDLDQVGQNFPSPLRGTYSASGNTGTLIISEDFHELLRSNALTPVPDTFTPIIFQFDLTTFEATSQPASGAMAAGQLGMSFTQNALGTTTVAGFMGPDVPPLSCTSQGDVDFACMFVPSFCGQTCTIVPGAAYDTNTGLVNLVGTETQYGCDGSLCDGPFTMFTSLGDLMLTEAPPLRALHPAVVPVAIAVLVLVAVVALPRLLRKRPAR